MKQIAPDTIKAPMTRLRKLTASLFWLGLAGMLGVVLVCASAFLYLSPKLPSAESYRHLRLENPLRIFSADGKLIAEFGNQRRDPVRYEEIPPQLINALIASEDSRFYSHNGVDLRALARSVIGIVSGRQSGGGSTLTMQVAKNISFAGEDPYSRKFKEILLALQIERELGKQEILELYFNLSFFGISAYGISAASTQYYDKPPAELSLSEMATMVAILPAPNTYNPLRSPELARALRSRVLRRMHELDMISRQQRDLANSAPLTAERHGRSTELQAHYIAEMIRQQMVERYGEKAMIDGFEVYTTVDSRLQQLADKALETGLENYDHRHGYRGPENHYSPGDSEGEPTERWLELLAGRQVVADQHPAFVTEVRERGFTALLKTGEEIDVDWEGMRWAKRYINVDAWGSTPDSAGEVLEPGDLIRVTPGPEGAWQLGQVPAVNGAMVALEPDNGAIRALSGGYDFFASRFNRVTQAQRQPGSNFKPFLYAAALENGYTAASLINDAPLPRSDYRPENFNREFMGPIRLKYALVNSKNLVSLRLYDALGEDVVLPYVDRFGFNSVAFPRNDLTVAIGSHAVTPLEIAAGYSVFANGGHQVEPYLIERIENFNDGLVYKARPREVCDPCGLPEPMEITPADGSSAPEFYQMPNPAEQVIDERVAYIMNSMLRSVITDGSGRPANRAIGRADLAGKTGTTNEAADLWFSGYNGDLLSTVYVGFDQPSSLGRSEQAATVSLPIWIDFMKTALEGKPERVMSQPDGLVTVRIDPKTGLRTHASDENAIFETFLEDRVPEFNNDDDDSALEVLGEEGDPTRIF